MNSAQNTIKDFKTEKEETALSNTHSKASWEDMVQLLPHKVPINLRWYISK